MAKENVFAINHSVSTLAKDSVLYLELPEERYNLILEAHENKHQSAIWEERLRLDSERVQTEILDFHFELPGHGHALDSCGIPFTLAHDAGKEWHFRKVKHNCHRFDCPYCNYDHDDSGDIRLNSKGNPVMSGWLLRASRRASDRIEYYFANVYRGKFRRKPIHVVISPPQGIQLKNGLDFKRLRRSVYSIAQEAGLDGGFMVFHPLRIPSRFNVKDFCVKGPHFHIIGSGWINHDNVRSLYSNRGYIIKNVGVRDSVFSTAGYVLSHCGRGILPSANLNTRKNLEAGTWFGTMHTSKFKIEKDKIGDDYIFCKVCKQEIAKKEWIEVAWGDRGPPSHTDHGVILKEFTARKTSIISGKFKAERLELVQ